MINTDKRVVITGLGTVNPLADNVEDFWDAIVKVKNGISRVTLFDPSDFASQVGGQVNNFDPKSYINSKESRRMDRFTIFAVISALQAVQDAGIACNGAVDREKIGVIVGNGIGGVETFGKNVEKLLNQGPKAIHPLFAPTMIANIAAGNIAIRLDAHGPCHTIVTACSSGTDAIGNAYRWIKHGTATVMICGGTEAALTPIGLAAFGALRALSTKYNAEPAMASRPFDKGRDGFVLSEGAGMIVLEELEHARNRGACIYAELAGYGATCDAFHLTAPHENGAGAVSAMRMAIESGGLSPRDIEYINAHGTATPINDPVENMAIKAVFGEHARQLKISSTKSMIGHLLGAAGGVEAVVTALALYHQYYPATRNLTEPDPDCDLNYLPGEGVKAPMQAALSNSFAFGGHNAVLLFKRYSEED